MLWWGIEAARANEEGIPILGAALPDPFPLAYRDRYIRLTGSAFQSPDLLGGMEPRMGGLSRRTNLELKEALSEPSGELLLEVRAGRKWNIHARKMLDPDASSQFGVGGSYALLERRFESEKSAQHPDDPSSRRPRSEAKRAVPAGLRSTVITVGGEATYMRGSSRPRWAMEGESVALHISAGVHMFKRVNLFAGWREQGGVYHVRMQSGTEEGVDRFFLRLGGPLAGLIYEGKYVGISYQGQAAMIGGLSPVVPLQAVSFFVQF